MEFVINNVKTKMLKDVSFRVFEGSVTSVLGNAGSGKSLLASVISTMSKPIQGSIQLDENTIDLTSEFINYSAIRKDISYIPQDTEKMFFYGTVFENMQYGIAFYKKCNDKKLRDALKMVGLSEDYLNRNTKILSDGERFLVLLAISLIINPQILILDDPTCFLDLYYEDLVLKLLRKIKTKYKKTILILSNNSDFLYNVSDYIYILNKGKIVMHGSPSNVFNDKKISKYNIKCPNILEVENMIVKKTQNKMMGRLDINDLIKDIYYYVERGNI